LTFYSWSYYVSYYISFNSSCSRWLFK